MSKRTFLAFTALLLAPLVELHGAESESQPKDATKPVSFSGELQPANPNLILEARNVLAYLKSIEGKKTLTGISDSGGWRSFYEWSGRAPATYSVDCFCFRKPRFGPEYIAGLQKSVDLARYWWEEKGGIPSMHFHWGKPGNPEGIAWIKDQ